MTTTIHVSGLNTQACGTSRFIGASLIHPASDSPLRVGPRTSLLTWWLTFNQVGFESLLILTHWVTISNFIPHCANPNDLSLSRHDHAVVRPKGTSPFSFCLLTYRQSRSRCIRVNADTIRFCYNAFYPLRLCRVSPDDTCSCLLHFVSEASLLQVLGGGRFRVPRYPSEPPQ